MYTILYNIASVAKKKEDFGYKKLAVIEYNAVSRVIRCPENYTQPRSPELFFEARSLPKSHLKLHFCDYFFMILAYFGIP